MIKVKSLIETNYCEHAFNCYIYFVGGEPITASEYFGIGRVTEFKYGRQLSDVFHKKTALKYLVNWGVGWGMMPDGNALVFIDNHDNQRGHGGGGDLLTFREPKLYKVYSITKSVFVLVFL